MQSFLGLALMVPEIIRGSPLGPLNGKKKPGLNRVKWHRLLSTQRICDQLEKNNFDFSFCMLAHRIDKRKSFVFARQYGNYFSRRINALVPRN